MSADDIVVCGIGGRFPGADNVDEFWTLLTNGENHMQDIPPERCNMAKHYDPDPNQKDKTYVKRAALIKNIYDWDYGLYGISKREAETIDPQQRLVLDSVYMAMEDAGISVKELEGSNTPVYIGAMNDDFKGTYYDHAKTIDGMAATGLFPTLISARVSYVFNLLGTAATIDTACSSSLVAIHMACQALKYGECDAAIAGGVNFISNPMAFIVLSKARMLSPTGQCHAFSRDADGYARGEGCGIVILKKLKQALKDGNPIWGIIRTDTNQDGRTVTPVNAPSKVQQLNLLRHIYSTFNVDRQQVQVIEAHGTGTPIGDPTETDALGEFFTEKGIERDQPILVGSVKTNIGHLESAAGVAGLIKVLLMMKHKTIVPSLLYSKENQNPRLKFEMYQMEVAEKLTEWQRNKENPRMACVNSFGFGGTNAHAIIQEFTGNQKEETSACSVDCVFQDMKHIIALSAVDEYSLVENVKSFQTSLKDANISLHAISHTSTCRRSHHNKRLAFVVKSEIELQRECIHFVNNPKQVLPKRSKATQILFFFCGVGTSWNGMGKELLYDPIFKTAVEAVDLYLTPLTGWSIIEAWRRDRDMKDPFLNHISIFTYQVGLIALWNHWGIKADVIVGQSVGEVAAAYCSGALDLKNAVALIFHRSTALAQCTEGTLLAVLNVAMKTVKELCSDKGNALSIACYNSSTSCVVAGRTEDILDLKKQLKKDKNAVTYDIDVSCAYHSPFVEEAAEALNKALENEKISGNELTVPMASTVTGKLCGRWELESPLYWAENVRQPVQLFSAINVAKDIAKNTLIVEIGPRPVLRAQIEPIFGNTDGVLVIPSVLKQKESEQLKEAVATLYMHGLNISWHHIVKPCGTNSSVPRYRFTRHFTVYPMESVKKGEAAKHGYVSETSMSFAADVRYSVVLNQSTTPFVYEHFVKGVPIVPGATYADVGFEIGMMALGVQKHEIEVSLDFVTPVRLGTNTETELSVKTTRKTESLVLFVVFQGNTVVCKGASSKRQRSSQNPHKVINPPLSFSTEYSHEYIYNQLKRMGFEYGDCLKQVTKICTNGGDACVGHLTLHKSVVENIYRTHFHACVIDCLLQVAGVMIHLEDATNETSNDLKIMPIGLGKIHISGRLSEKLTAHAMRINRTVMPSMLKEHYNIFIYDDCGTLVAAIENAAFFGSLNNKNSPDMLRYRLAWEPIALQIASTESKPCNIIAINSTGRDIFQPMVEEGSLIHVKTSLQSLAKNPESIKTHVNSVLLQRQLSIKNVDAIVYLCEAAQINEDITMEIYDKAIHQCKAIGYLVDMLNDLSDKPPTYVVTERVYHGQQISPLGAEVWGYLRTVVQEDMFLDLTMIDVSPSVEHCSSKLIKFVKDHIDHDETIPIEFAFNGEQLLTAKLVHTTRKEMVPAYCNNICTADDKLVIKTTDTETFSTEEPNHKEFVKNKEDKWKKVEVDYVCLHSSYLYPCFEMESSCGVNETCGNALMALEYVGHVKQESPTSPALIRCDSQKTQVCELDAASDDKWGTVVLWPSACAHVITVPKECTISLRRRPWYRPGLFSLATVCYSLSNRAPTNDRVGVVCVDKSDHFTQLFSVIMMRKKLSYELVEVADLSSTNTIAAPDCVILLAPMDSRVYKWLRGCKEIIGLSSMIPDTLKTNLCVSDNVLVTCVDEKTLFNRSNIRKTLKKVVKLLAKLDLPTFKSMNNLGMKRAIQLPSDVLHMRSKRTRFCNHPMRVSPQNLFRKDAIYILTGGLTGLGWELLLQMAEMGAGVLVTFSRSSCSEEMAKTIAAVEKEYLCSICHLIVDVIDEMSVKAGFAEIRKRFPSKEVRGVIHGAGVVKSQLFASRTDDGLIANLGPKIAGTLNLHNSTKHLPLDYFVMHSSINSVFGSHGQAAYGAANNFMSEFAAWIRGTGRPALSIRWGALDVGMAAKTQVRKELENKGHILITKDEIRDCFIHALLHNDNNAVYAHLDKAVVARDFSNRAMLHLSHKYEFLREEGLLKDENETKQSDLRIDFNLYQDLNESEKRELLLHLVKSLAQGVFGCLEDDCLPSTTYVELGIDSMSAMVFSNLLFEKTNFRLSLQLLFQAGHALKDTVAFLYEFFKYQDASDDGVIDSDADENNAKQKEKKRQTLRSTRWASRMMSDRRHSSTSSAHSLLSDETTGASRVLPRTNSTSIIAIPKLVRQYSGLQDGRVENDYNTQL